MRPIPRPAPAAARLGALLAPLVVGLGLAGCAATSEMTDFSKHVTEKSGAVRTGPQDMPIMSDTGFGPALRCMDILFINYGVRNLTVLIEDVPDATRKINASGKDMIISAMSQMTRRSRGINLMAFSINDQTLGAVIGMGTRNKVVETPPDFTIRGSVSQFDEAIVRKQADGGVSFGAFSFGAAKQAQGSVLALDLSVIDTHSLNLVPGVTSKNSVLVLKEGSGGDGEVNTRKFGLNFSFVLSKSEGNAQALRTLAELAAIELMGKLTKTPYWSCLGANDQSAGVEAEITDWWETLAAEPISLVAYFQQQMIARRLYAGEVNGQVDDALLHAIGLYQQAMGRERSTTLNYDFFRAYLATDHATVQPKAQALLKADPGPQLAAAGTTEAQPDASVAPAAAAASTAAANAANAANTAAAAPPAGEVPFVYVAGLQGKQSIHRRGQPFEIDVAVDQDTHLYCYLLDENRRINQFFPHPMRPDSTVKGGTRMQFPGPLPFKFVASSRGVTESVACFAAPSALGNEPLRNIPVASSTDELAAQFRKVAGPRIGIGVYDVKTQ